MRTTGSIFAVLLMLSGTGFSQSPRNARPLTAKPDEAWVIRWNRSDDFNSESIDWKKWNPKPENFGAWTWNNEQNATVSDGQLKLTLRREARSNPEDVSTEGRTGDVPSYTSGMLKSFAKGSYGYYEARIKGCPLFPGACPSFWLYSNIDDKIVGPGEVRYSEVDVVELTQRGTNVEGNEKVMDHNLHTILSNGKPGIPGRQWRRPEKYPLEQASEYHAPFDPRDDFHIYGCEVGRSEIVWYVDGVEVGRKENLYWHRPMNVALSLGLRAPFAKFEDNRLVPSDVDHPEQFPTSMQVDYVRVWEIQN